MTKDEALRLALEAMKINNKAWKLLADSGDAGNWEAEEQGYYQLNEQAINAIKEALETKDEFVAWEQFHEHMAGPNYVAPQRTWVGLTDEEIYLIAWPHGGETMQAIIKHTILQAEQLVKEKNI